jgi:hypothetical protein
MILQRKYLDLSNLTLDGQRLPIEYVKSSIIWKSEEPAFQHIIKELEDAPQPGFFLTSRKTDKDVRVRWNLNRHCILKSDVFYDSHGTLYRDIDAKGVGYTKGFPMRFLSVREPEMDGDMEMRGILHNNVASGDCLRTEEINKLGIRLARYVAQIELFELVNQKGQIVPRQEIGKELMLNFDGVRPTLGIRAMGTTARVQDPHISPKTNNKGYVKEIIDDAIGIVSLELGCDLKPEEYAVWFVETMGKQLGRMHKNGIWTDFMAQIHQGTHNVTLDCRLTDTYHYQTPESIRREYERLVRDVEKDPRFEWMMEERFPKDLTEDEARANNSKGEERDRWTNAMVARSLVNNLDMVYPLGSLKSEAEDKFNAAYTRER